MVKRSSFAGFMPLIECSIPVWAYGGLTGPDTYNTQSRTPPIDRCHYPYVGTFCRNPPPDIHQPSGIFPIYFGINKCNDGDLRVALALFYEKDGAWCDSAKYVLEPKDTGHDL